MNPQVPKQFLLTTLALGCAVVLVGCETTAGNIALGTVIGTAIVARSPSNEIEQTYYLGVFDPQEQLPQAVYRLRVHGQASAMSGVKFNSGWVRAELVDSLTGQIKADPLRSTLTTSQDRDQAVTLNTSRRLVLFGPEGFREAPKDHRLVVVMGSSPEKFFNAIDQTLGTFAAATQGVPDQGLEKALFDALLQLKSDRASIDRIQASAKSQ